MKPFIKICGITNTADALAACELGADALGFIFYKKSPRYILPAEAGKIISLLPREILSVGVFVNRPRSEIDKIIGHTGIRVVQLHGAESPEECKYDNARVWKAIRPRNGDVLIPLNKFNVDAYVIDTYNRSLYGGTGKTGNWKFAQKAALTRRIILSGGLNPGNIAEALTIVKPFGVDINSGIEKEAGKKDHKKLKELFTVLNTF